jgi:hypothetical protein
MASTIQNLNDDESIPEVLANAGYAACNEGFSRYHELIGTEILRLLRLPADPLRMTSLTVILKAGRSLFNL